MSPTAQQVGYYGKLPARGDFVGRRLPPDTVAAWDDWLQEAITASQEALGPGWKERYYVSPLWRFVIPAGLCGRSAIAGVMMPSVDKVGRCYPLMIGQTAAADTDLSALSDTNDAWFERVEELALTCLADDFLLETLDQPIPSLSQKVRTSAAGTVTFPGGEAGVWFSLMDSASLSERCGAVAAHGLPATFSLWWSTGSPDCPAVGVIADRLPRPESFTAFLTGDWDSYGWRAAEVVAPVEPMEAAIDDWDREG